MNPGQKPGKGSERVKAWVYTILNPLIESLRRESDLLRRSNLTWRAHSERCEFIRPIAELINPAYEPNFDDFLAEQESSLRDRFEEHDAALASLEDAASKFFQGLVQSDLFQKKVREYLRDYETMRSSNPTLPDLVGPAYEKAPEYIAEYLINQTENLPQHYTMYAFWETFRPEFSAVRDRNSFSSIKRSAKTLLTLTGDLEDLRLSLCREYDVPAAPFERPQGTPSSNVQFR